MYDITVVGGGNVATHMYEIFKGAGLKSSMAIRGESSESDIYRIDALPHSKIYLIAVKDSAIEEVAQVVASQVDKDSIICHTAGSVSIEAIGTFEKRGVFYPLQSFTKGEKLSNDDFTIFIEAESSDTLLSLKELAYRVGHRSVELSSRDRERMHLAAVFTSNFTNHMYVIAEKILKGSGVEFSHMTPLISECVEKVKKSNLSPRYLQTGPAARGDREIINHHIEMLEDQATKDIYRILSNSIESIRDEKL